MLVISRKPGEKLRIGDSIEIVVLEISGSRAVIGIDAPKDIVIRRIGAARPEEEDLLLGTGHDDGPEHVAMPEPRSVAPVTDGRTPFEYPSRAQNVPDISSARVPLVTVRRSRKRVAPSEGEDG